ncbi:hypothetical protein NXU93_02450 [Bacteroides fragilis]|nr:hypothetical protein [Bacteroides fragilis]
MERWINSERVPVYSPITDFLYDLPRWDGKDCIRALARYVRILRRIGCKRTGSVMLRS